ncbi:glutathione S-transferase [Roseobacter sp. SK209-2-6]|uniref:glutathione transferase GstA n=1 Tax=Roseobacter sp. SK209-2-6 TaxID=388739 RepID=UPI0000F3D7C5|nr:glutathione transferase GstA [Roseobacter sp. SK209-2-6]EBA17487.1 glutathione S-transferase [Roseobacter sp. SK209-2-6]
MKLYYKPGACPMASHIALHETGRAFEIEAVDTAVGRTETGADYHAINPKGYVPALGLDDGSILTEGPAILQYIADSHPEAGLAPKVGTLARARMQEQLNWIGTELHKAFGPLFRDGTSEAGKDEARTAVAGKFDLIEAQLADGREWLVAGQFSVADAYLFVVSNWANFTGIDLARWPNLVAFVTRTASRPSAQAAMRAEGLIQ